MVMSQHSLGVRVVLGVAAGLFVLTTTSCNEGAPTKGPCACVVDEPAQTEKGVGPMVPDCAAQLCEDIYSGEGIDGSFYVDPPEAIDCALEALRDRSPGLIRWYTHCSGR